MKTFTAIIVAFMLAALAPRPSAWQAGDADAAATALLPTNHPKVPRDISRLWLVPERSRRAPATFNNLATAVRLESSGEFTRALTLLSEPELRASTLGGYASYYAAEASLKLGRNGDAMRAFRALEARRPVGYLAEAAAIGEAEADEAQSDFLAAVAVYERLLNNNIGAPDDISMRLGKAARAGGDTTKAADAFARVYYDYALSELAPSAGAELMRLSTLEPIVAGSTRYKRELARAERLFSAKLYGPARSAFDGILASAAGDDRELVSLRIAECDYFLKHARVARDEVQPFLEHASRQGEALFFYGVSSLDLSDRQTFVTTLRRVADDFPSQTWAEEALDSLATFYIQKADDDDQADRVLLEQYTKYPKGSHAERAAWRVGWRAYRERRYGDTIRVFEQAAHDFPRSDYRPPWLYWSGRAHEALGETAIAEERYKLELADYRNTYHGRLAIKRLNGYTPPPRVILAATADPNDPAPPFATLPPNAQTIRDLLSVSLFDAALNELQYAVRAWGDTSPVEATIAWIERQRGRSETGLKQYNDWRGSMNVMKRAYPQYLAAGGETLPRDVQVVIFPLAYWDTIKKYSAVNDLDPYIVAALTAQESTFVADIKSYASAVGLMQFIAPTARQYAKRVNLTYSSRLLTNPDANLKMGTAYLADLTRNYGGAVYLALAAYNGGPANVRRWINERPDMPQDEFIEDIPYPQTQNYVKKIIATAEDYRRLYGPDAEHGDEPDLDAKLASTGVKTTAAPLKTAPAAKKAAPARPAAKKAASAKTAPSRRTSKNVAPAPAAKGRN